MTKSLFVLSFRICN